MRNLRYFCLVFAFFMLSAFNPAFSYSSSTASEDREHKISVRNAIGKNFASLAACLEEFSIDHPDIKEVNLEFVVWTNGRFYNVKIEPKDQASEECIEELLKKVSVPFPEKPKDYSFKIDLDTHVRHLPASNQEIEKDALAKEKKGKKRTRRHTLSMDLLTPVVTGALGLGVIFLFEYEIAVNRWVAISVTGMAGHVSKDEKLKIQGQKYEGTIKGRGGGGGGGLRVFPLGKAPKGLLLGAQVRAYMFVLEFDECPDNAEEGDCNGELKVLDALFEAGWRFIFPFGLSLQLSAEAGAQFGRSIYKFESDPAVYFGGRAAVGWSF